MYYYFRGRVQCLVSCIQHAVLITSGSLLNEAHHPVTPSFLQQCSVCFLELRVSYGLSPSLSLSGQILTREQRSFPQGPTAWGGRIRIWCMCVCVFFLTQQNIFYFNYTSSGRRGECSAPAAKGHRGWSGLLLAHQPLWHLEDLRPCDPGQR